MALYNMSTRAVLSISGEGAEKLLHDTLTCRFDGTLGGTGRWFALLSPQGKVQVDGLVTLTEGVFWFDVKTELAADFAKKMKLYRLRAKAEIELRPDRAVLWSPDGTLPEGAITYRDERDPGLGVRAIVPAASAEGLPIAGDNRPDDPFVAAAIAAGLADGFAPNEVFAHDIGLDLLGGIDFVKGCYIGQEVVSRMKHRGTARRRPVIVSGIDGNSAPGTAVLASGREAGVIGPVAKGRAVAIIRLDRITDPGAVTVGGAPVTLDLPDWATYRLGEPDAEAKAEPGS